LLVEAELADGRLVALDRRVAARGYWLLAPTPQWRQRKVRALVEALAG